MAEQIIMSKCGSIRLAGTKSRTENLWRCSSLKFKQNLARYAI